MSFGFDVSVCLLCIENVAQYLFKILIYDEKIIDFDLTHTYKCGSDDDDVQISTNHATIVILNLTMFVMPQQN